MAPNAQQRNRRSRVAERQRAQSDARQRAADRSRKKRQWIGVGVISSLIALSGGAVLAASGAKTPSSTSTTSTTTGPAPSSSIARNTNPPASLPTVAPGATITGNTPCPAADNSAARTTRFAKAPPVCIDAAKDYVAVIHTTKGDVEVLLNAEQAPNTVNNFVVLSRYHYFDGMPVTRVVPRGWFEVGEAANGSTGSAGPGYTIAGEAPPGGSIPSALMIAMLPGADGANGGAFLLGSGDQSPALAVNATIFGTILDNRVDRTPGSENTNTVNQEIDRLGTASGVPAEVVTITGVDIREEASAR